MKTNECKISFLHMTDWNLITEEGGSALKVTRGVCKFLQKETDLLSTHVHNGCMIQNVFC